MTDGSSDRPAIVRLVSLLPARDAATVMNVVAHYVLRAAGRDETLECGVCSEPFDGIWRAERHFRSEHPDETPHYNVGGEGSP